MSISSLIRIVSGVATKPSTRDSSETEGRMSNVSPESNAWNQAALRAARASEQFPARTSQFSELVATPIKPTPTNSAVDATEAWNTLALSEPRKPRT